METKKTSFFKRIKYAIFNFEEYQNFAMEKTRVAIKYILKIVLLLSLVISIITTYKMLGDLKSAIKNQLPEFEIKDNELLLDNETGEHIFKDNMRILFFYVRFK